MKRIYYLFNGTQPASAIAQDLQQVGINNGQLHFLNRNTAALDSQQVHRASFLQEKDIEHSGIYGAFIGATAGIFFSLYLILSSLGEHMTLSILLFVVGVFTFFGSWVGGIVGISRENHHIEAFHNAIEHGDTLLMLDTYTPTEEKKAKDIMFSRHLEATYEGEDPKYKEFL